MLFADDNTAGVDDAAARWNATQNGSRPVQLWSGGVAHARPDAGRWTLSDADS